MLTLAADPGHNLQCSSEWLSPKVPSTHCHQANSVKQIMIEQQMFILELQDYIVVFVKSYTAFPFLCSSDIPKKKKRC